MKANEAPEKIYLTSNENGTHYYTENLPFERKYVEYIRTEAFVEKAIKYVANRFLAPGMDNEIKNFRKYMEGG